MEISTELRRPGRYFQTFPKKKDIFLVRKFWTFLVIKLNLDTTLEEGLDFGYFTGRPLRRNPYTICKNKTNLLHKYDTARVLSEASIYGTEAVI